MKAVLVESDLLTAYGHGIDACWRGLLSGQSAIRPLTRFNTGAFASRIAATVEGLAVPAPPSLCAQMLTRLFEGRRAPIPADAFVLLATTAGEIDLLERHLLTGAGMATESDPARLLNTLRGFCGSGGGGMVVSAACASAGAALGQAAGMIRSGLRDCVLVAACDSVTEFVFSGFSSLMALDPEAARPFDRRRRGLSLGDGAAYALLMSEKRARREGRPVQGTIEGWGLSNDANHMTGPSRDGSGLASALRRALHSAELSEEQVAFLSAHGTGTPYNDAMEMKAFKSVFTRGPLPCYGIKGAVGHTLGAAGMIETLVALQALRQGSVPPTVGLAEADDDAAGWFSPSSAVVRGQYAAVINAGFGGINSGLILSGGMS